MSIQQRIVHLINFCKSKLKVGPLTRYHIFNSRNHTREKEKIGAKFRRLFVYLEITESLPESKPGNPEVVEKMTS